MTNRRILFITGTRADFGKLKSLIHAVQNMDGFKPHVFATGMHTLLKYGETVHEIYKEGLENIHTFVNQFIGEPADMVLANTIQGVSRFVHEAPPDMIVVHGDRVESVAGAIVGALNNILVAHIEGGERSGTIDESIRHATSKFAHLHFVANQDAANRLIQLGENPASVFVIGSPDMDIMISKNLPAIDKVKEYYAIDFEKYFIALYHPVTTEINKMKTHVNVFVDALLETKKETVLVYPNNDPGAGEILSAYEKLDNIPFIKIFPSLRFEYFLTLLKHADLIIGNSSAGIREASFYGVPAVNIGTRQNKRFQHDSICNVSHDKQEIIRAVQKMEKKKFKKTNYFGNGDSDKKFIEIISSENVWKTPKQKYFMDLP